MLLSKVQGTSKRGRIGIDDLWL